MQGIFILDNAQHWTASWLGSFPYSRRNAPHRCEFKAVTAHYLLGTQCMLWKSSRGGGRERWCQHRAGLPRAVPVLGAAARNGTEWLQIRNVPWRVRADRALVHKYFLDSIPVLGSMEAGRALIRRAAGRLWISEEKPVSTKASSPLWKGAALLTDGLLHPWEKLLGNRVPRGGNHGRHLSHNYPESVRACLEIKRCEPMAIEPYSFFLSPIISGF